MKPRLHQACLLAGSNIEPEKNLVEGLERLKEQVQVLRLSSVWQSPSVGSEGPDFLNLAALVRTPYSLERLKLEVLRPLEAALGRIRTTDKNAPRPLDLDIVLFDGKLVDPELFQQAHRAVPVAELLPDLTEKGRSLGQAAAEMAQHTPIQIKPGVLMDA